jgi:hypothetical protein
MRYFCVMAQSNFRKIRHNRLFAQHIRLWGNRDVACQSECSMKQIQAAMEYGNLNADQT